MLAIKMIMPGAWTGKLEFQPGVLEYQGDGSGAVKLRISPAKTSSKRFQGAIDNLQWREKSEANGRIPPIRSNPSALPNQRPRRSRACLGERISTPIFFIMDSG